MKKKLSYIVFRETWSLFKHEEREGWFGDQKRWKVV
jgi:hypothetical protein